MGNIGYIKATPPLKAGRAMAAMFSYKGGALPLWAGTAKRLPPFCFWENPAPFSLSLARRSA